MLWCAHFFNTLLIITHGLLTSAPAFSAPFSLCPSLFRCPSCLIPPQPLSLVSGLACLHFGGGLEGMTWSLRWKKNQQRPIRGQRVRSAVTLLAAEEIKHIFISRSHPSLSADLSFPRPGREESGLEFVFVTLNVCARGQCVFVCVCVQ